MSSSGGASSGTGLQQAPTPRGYDAAFRLTVAGGLVDGGTYRLTFRGQQTAAITWNEDPYTKLAALSNIGDLDVSTYDGALPTPVYVFFTGTLANTDIVVGVDVTISAQALTNGVDPVTLVIDQWENGAAPGTVTPIAQAVVDIGGVTGNPTIWANVGTTGSPDWRALNGFYAYDATLNIADGTLQLSDSAFFVQLGNHGVVQNAIALTPTTFGVFNAAAAQHAAIPDAAAGVVIDVQARAALNALLAAARGYGLVAT